MEDRELLELAAKAAGYLACSFEGGVFLVSDEFDDDLEDYIYHHWNPLTDDGDALRLAAHLEITIHWENDHVEVFQFEAGYLTEPFSLDSWDKASSARRAIVRAAALIAKSM